MTFNAPGFGLPFISTPRTRTDTATDAQIERQILLLRRALDLIDRMARSYDDTAGEVGALESAIRVELRAHRIRRGAR